MSHYECTESFTFIQESAVFIRADTIRMVMTMLHLLYDHNAFKMQRMIVFWPLQKLTWTSAYVDMDPLGGIQFSLQ